MTAVSVTWTAKDASRLDPGKPITTGLKNNEWDNLTFLAEWLGADYLAGAVQNHDHDGVNSAPIEALPNLVKNGSFERDGGGGVPAGWAFTAYTGGSQAIYTAGQAHGKACGAITSTVLANGGGYYQSANFFEVGASEDYLWKIWRAGSAANISSKAEVVWYNAAEAQISVTTLFSVAATETSFTEVRGRVTAPATARLAKLRLTGGVPGSGAAVGTVYFDGVMVPDFPRIDTTSIQPGGVGQAAIAASAVGQSQLKTSYGTVSTTAYHQLLGLPGGQYGYWPQVASSVTAARTYLAAPLSPLDASVAGSAVSYGLPTTWATYISLGTSNANVIQALQRYVTACRPYDLGDGEVAHFVFALVDASGKIESVYAAPDAPWHNNGPTDIRADVYDANGRGWRWQDVRETEWVWDDDAQDHVPRTSVTARERIEITQSIKQLDMPLVPHPFFGDITGKTVVLLDPVADLTWQLDEMHSSESASPNELLHDDYLRIDNTALNRAGPPGVMVVSYKWKLT